MNQFKISNTANPFWYYYPHFKFHSDLKDKDIIMHQHLNIKTIYENPAMLKPRKFSQKDISIFFPWNYNTHIKESLKDNSQTIVYSLNPYFKKNIDHDYSYVTRYQYIITTIARRIRDHAFKEMPYIKIDQVSIIPSATAYEIKDNKLIFDYRNSLHKRFEKGVGIKPVYEAFRELDATCPPIAAYAKFYKEHMLYKNEDYLFYIDLDELSTFYLQQKMSKSA